MSETGKTIALIKALTPPPLDISGKLDAPDSAGTSGQVLTSDGNGGQVWANIAAGEVVIDDTLSVPGAAAEATAVGDLKSAIDEVTDNALVIDETAKGYYHNFKPKSVTFYPNEKLATVSAKYTGSKNLLDGLFISGKQSEITKTLSGRIINLNGTGTSLGLGFVRCLDSTVVSAFKGKTYNVYVYLSKTTSWEHGNYFQLYDGVGTPIRQWLQKTGTTMFGWTEFKNVTINANASQIYIYFTEPDGVVFEEGDFIWIGMYETTAVDTQQTLSGDDPYTMTVSGLNCIDTMMHESTIEHLVPTKSYVDEHTPDIIGYWNERVYLLPENYGAVGDGTADDGQALNDCLAAAALNGMAVRGYKNYKTTSPIIISGSNLDVFINKINYTGSTDAAAVISGTHNRIEIHTINSNADGLTMRSSSSLPANYSMIMSHDIHAENNGVVLDRETNGNGNILYNIFRIDYVAASNGDCYKNKSSGASGYTGENVFYNTKCSCPNGWAINLVGGRFFGFSMESNVLNGIVAAGESTFEGFRYIELVDKVVLRLNGHDEFQGGTLIKIPNSVYVNGIRFIGTSPVPYCAIDVDDAYNSNDFSESDLSAVARMVYPNVIDAPIRFGNLETPYGFHLPGKRMYIVEGRKICEPMYQNTVTVTDADYDMREAQMWLNHYKQFATKFVIGVNDCVIHLPTDYCCMGYNEFIVDQTNYTCTIYKALDDITPIFDGETLGAGVYSLKAYSDPEQAYIATHRTWTSGRMYDTTNDVWEVTKLS